MGTTDLDNFVERFGLCVKRITQFGQSWDQAVVDFCNSGNMHRGWEAEKKPVSPCLELKVNKTRTYHYCSGFG
jgi:hypothetical protein